MVLDVDREVVLFGVGRDALRDGPGNENAIAFEPEVPVEAASMVLLDHEPRRLGLLARNLGAGFWCLLEIALGLVFSELLGHQSKG
jgi:hypothetical protein